MALDDELGRIAMGADSRLAFQAAFSVVTPGTPTASGRQDHEHG
jgi:hypothetical protein